MLGLILRIVAFLVAAVDSFEHWLLHVTKTHFGDDKTTKPFAHERKLRYLTLWGKLGVINNILQALT